MKPTGEIYFTPTLNWSIQYSREVRRPNVDAYIRFYSNATDEIVHQINVHTNLDDVKYADNRLTFFTTIQWNIVNYLRFSIDLTIVFLE